MSKRAKIKPFRDWLYEEVSSEFGLARLAQHPFLIEIDSLELDPHHPAVPRLGFLQSVLNAYVDTWNEDELRTMFISPLISLVEFVHPNYKVFTQRPLSVQYAQGTKLTEGLVEFMLAKGLQVPQKPHFFLHEYKPEKRRDTDPLGQLLIAMVASQHLNADQKPVYGVFVTGRLWFFVVLEQGGYAVSKSYSTEDEEIFKVFAILEHLKSLMGKIYAE
jgi:hypothetical protein